MTRKDWLLMQALQRQEEKLDEIKRRSSWWLDFSSNVAGNAAWEALTWLATKIIRKL